MVENLDKNATVVPVGLDFGPSRISIQLSFDRTNASEGPDWTYVPCGQAYKDFYKDALTKKVQTDLVSMEPSSPDTPLVPTKERASELVQAFARHIKDARLMGMRVLDKTPPLDLKVMAITVPDHWDVSARTVVAEAAKLAGQPLDNSFMILSYPQAVQSAHDLSNDTAGQYLTLIIQYNKSDLHLMLVQMSETGCMMIWQVWAPSLSEDASESPSAGRAADFEDFDDTAPVHSSLRVNSTTIVEYVEEFLLWMIPSDDSSSATESSPRPNEGFCNVRYMIIDGEAYSRDRTALSGVIEDRFFDGDRTSIEEMIGNCGATGAILAARQQFQNPQHLGDWKDLPEYVPADAK